MMERLNEYMEAQKFLETLDWDDIPNSSEHLATICEALQEIQKYKYLEEQGLLLRLPVQIGTTVYKFEPLAKGTKRYIKTTITRYEVFDDSIWFTFANGLGRNIEDFGKFVFLTQAEAERKLKEMNTDNGIAE